ncbi:hypothetical protein WA158_007428 [Blastocystis sp. Blastoise]
METAINSVLREQPKPGCLFLVESSDRYYFNAFQISCVLTNMIQRNMKQYSNTSVLSFDRNHSQIEHILSQSHKIQYINRKESLLQGTIPNGSILYIDTLSPYNSTDIHVVLSHLHELDDSRSFHKEGYYNSIITTVCNEDWNKEYLNILYSMASITLKIESNNEIKCFYKKPSGKLVVLFLEYRWDEKDNEDSICITEQSKENKEEPVIEDSFQVIGETRDIIEDTIYMTHSDDDENFDLDNDLDL